MAEIHKYRNNGRGDITVLIGIVVLKNIEGGSKILLDGNNNI